MVKKKDKGLPFIKFIHQNEKTFIQLTYKKCFLGTSLVASG